ncbi:hypothetical protein M378DRAFT_338833 [Amanita muscaria Koide BX008]|uniref:Uncharacterized protein n=1 Tax=Amanita muscaria (strain Koide BX008) TaxID=946122 RepID=A0A0C2WPF7_AMAMK|nr:hypothetical protein M378DRAFT_338833 [Amanita muscaria Koide BX008]
MSRLWRRMNRSCNREEETGDFVRNADIASFWCTTVDERNTVPLRRSGVSVVGKRRSPLIPIEKNVDLLVKDYRGHVYSATVSYTRMVRRSRLSCQG